RFSMRHRRRLSRVLLALLGLTIVLGRFTCMRRINASKALATSGRMRPVATVGPASPTTAPTTSSISAPASPATEPVVSKRPDQQAQPKPPVPTITQAPTTTADAAAAPSAKFALAAITAPAEKLAEAPALAAAPSLSSKVTV